jgi:hypothetical protein
VPQALDAAEGELEALAGGCGRIAAALEAAQRSGGGLLADAERIAAELAHSRARSALVDHFLAQYQLTPQEVAALQVRCVAATAPLLVCPSLYLPVIQGQATPPAREDALC